MFRGLIKPKGTAAALFAPLILATPTSSRAQQYQTDQPVITRALNQYWSLQGLGHVTAGVTPHWPAVFGSSDWFEWNSLKIAWTDDQADKDKQRSLLENDRIDGVNVRGAQAPGYVWPANDSELWIGVQPHFDQMPRFICAVYNDYLWSRDRGFLRRMRPKLEAVMDYLALTMRARDGLPRCPGPFNGRSGQGPNTTYMDCYREGGVVAWIAEGYATALADMEAIERVLGDRKRAAEYGAAARAYPARFDAQLWNAATHRYAGWRDGGGALHDYGFTYLNLEALARGLGDAGKADAIFRWLDAGAAQPTQAGGHVGSTDIYQCVVAPRSNTRAIPARDWDPWSVSPALRRTTMGYGALVEDGGALLWVNYYDILARLRWLDADSAWRKLTDLLFRVAGDPLLFTEDVTHPTNVYRENYLEVGPADGSENGIAGVTPLCGFMGVRLRPDGLCASPNLPTSLLFLECRGIRYGSMTYAIRVSRGQVVADASPLTSDKAQPLVARAPFNTLGLLLEPVTCPGCRATVRLEKRAGSAWADVVSTSIVVPDRAAYTYLAVSDQPAGAYRVVWPHGGGRHACRLVREPASATARGVFRRGQAAVAARTAFSRVLVRTAIGSPGVVTLSRRLGSHWRPVTAAWAAGPHGGVLSFADQPAGSYRLRLDRSPSGTYVLEANHYTIGVSGGGTAWSATVPAGRTVRLALPGLP